MTARIEPTPAQLIVMLRHAQAVAQRALDAGHHPFGAVLIAPDHETVLLEQGNVSTVEHAEAVLARTAAQRFAPAQLWDCTLVTTVEPCAMCAGTGPITRTSFWPRAKTSRQGRSSVGFSACAPVSASSERSSSP